MLAAAEWDMHLLVRPTAAVDMALAACLLRWTLAGRQRQTTEYPCFLPLELDSMVSETRSCSSKGQSICQITELSSVSHR